jgi:hypothetical protein
MPSDWIQFCKDYSSKHNIKYSEALKKCSSLYNKKGKATDIKVVEQSEPEPEPVPEEKPKKSRRKKKEIEMI